MADQIVAASTKSLKQPPYVFRPPPLELTAQQIYDRRAAASKGSAAAAVSLPLEELLLVGIFRYLSTSDLLRCGLVCQAWHKASLHPSLWHTVNLAGLFFLKMLPVIEL
jgi:F-box-like